jgi:hypothetical protein
MRRIFWFDRLRKYHLIPGLEDSMNPQEELPETHSQLYDLVKRAMENAHTKEFNMPVQAHKKLQHHISSLAHHAWPFNNAAKDMEIQSRSANAARRRGKTISLKASLEQMYSDEISLAWRLSKRRLRERQKFSVGNVTESGVSDAAEGASMAGVGGGNLKASQLVKDMCADGAFQILQDLETKINSIFVESSIPLGVTEEALRRSCGALQCRSPVKRELSEMQRLNDREAELEAELAGLDLALSVRRFGSRVCGGDDGGEELGVPGFTAAAADSVYALTPGMNTTLSMQMIDELSTTLEKETGTGAIGAKRLQPHLPHVLHDLPLVFGQASKYAYRGPNRLPPLMGSSYEMKTVPKTFEVLWPKPVVDAPHYPSADPVLLTEFVGTLGESLIL